MRRNTYFLKSSGGGSGGGTYLSECNQGIFTVCMRHMRLNSSVFLYTYVRGYIFYRRHMRQGGKNII